MLFRKRKRNVKRIMIVEDEPLVAFDNEVMLGEAGYEVVGTIDNFVDALDLLNGQTVDLILCDIVLAGNETGLDLAREAKLRSIPLLFVTGHPPEPTDLAIGILAKPYTERTLRAAIESVDLYLSGDQPEPVPGLEYYTAPVRRQR